MRTFRMFAVIVFVAVMFTACGVARSEQSVARVQRQAVVSPSCDPMLAVHAVMGADGLYDFSTASAVESVCAAKAIPVAAELETAGVSTNNCEAVITGRLSDGRTEVIGVCQYGYDIGGAHPEVCQLIINPYDQNQQVCEPAR